MASKFEIELEITGIKFKMKGDRNDVQAATQLLANQINGIAKPAGLINEPSNSTEDVEAEVIKENNHKPQKKRVRKSSNSSSGENSNETIDFRSDPNKYGTPITSWGNLEKALWIIYVAKNELQIDELSASQITNAFNKHFKQAGTMRGSNVSRVLGSRKLNSKEGKALVNENTSINPSTFFLVQDGERFVQELIAAQVSNSTTSVNGAH